MELAVGASAATLKSLLTKLGSLLAEEYALIRGVRGDIQFINDEFASMQAFLSNLARADGHDDQTKDWMKQVRDVSFDIEDCVDDFTHSLRPDPRGDGCLAAIERKVCEIRTASARRRIAAQIVDLKARAQQISERRTRYGVRNPKRGKNNGLDDVTQYHAAENQEITRQLVRVQKPVGVKKEDIEELHDWIVDGDDKKKLRVLSIVGFGGLGKTTVAMDLYRKYGDQFQRRAMVTVSQISEAEIVVRNILGQVKPEASDGEQQCENSVVPQTKNCATTVRSALNRICMQTSSQQNDASAWDDMHEGLRKELENCLANRYLLLIDDVWSSHTLKNIMRYFPDKKNGSRIIVTTRFPAVATTCCVDEDSHSVHQVTALSDDDSEKLFQRSLSECGVSGDNVPGRVWKMCGGLPLAIVTMAGLVASTKTTRGMEWDKVCKSLFPEAQVCRKPEDFMRIISHSYNNVASDLKTCSLYLSIFPKGSKISRKQLIRRGIAEDFLSEKQGLSVEDVAETCFNQLITRKIIRPVQHCSNGLVKSCQVHDMVLEYLISKAAEEDFATVVGSHWSAPTRSNKVRRLSLHTSDSNHGKQVHSMNLSHVRSLTMFGSLDKMRFESFKTGIVQVLDLQGCKGFKDNNVKVSQLCKMILLRYLNLRRTDIKYLPSNICNLKYLETLDIRETEILQLPKTIGQLERIINLLGGNKKTRQGVKLPIEIKKGTMNMNTLHVLSGIEITKGSTFASRLHEFTGLRKLAIYQLPEDEGIFKGLLSSIQYLGGYSLQTLVIDDESSDFLSTLDNMTAPPTYLSALELSGKLLKLPKWIPGLKELSKLTLSVTVLKTDNLVILSKLQSLFSLTFSVRAGKQDPDIAGILEKNKSDSRGGIFVPSGGFCKLKLLRIFIPLLPWLNFSKKATTHLERLELRFKRLEGFHGMDKLVSLHDVLVTVDGQASEATRLILANMKSQQSKYTLIINEYDD